MSGRTASVRPRRLVARTSLIAVLAIVGLTLSGCVGLFLPSQAPSTSTPVKETVATDLKPFYDQVLVWTSCGSGMQCTNAKAPLDWTQPSAGVISLALVRHQATGTRLGSLLVNPGGPGSSGYDFVKDSLDFAVDKTLQSSYDIVGFDPRGVGRSSSVACYDTAQLNDYIYDITPGVRGSDEWIASSEKAATDFGAACAANTGPLLAHVDTVSAARDLDMLRAALGDKKLNYLGYSYGTFLGATYAGLYPQKTGRLVLDGAVDPSQDISDSEVTQTVGFEKSLRAYVKSCIGTKGCPFTGSVDAGMASIAKMLASVDSSPIRNKDGRELGANTLVTAIIYPLYSEKDWPYLTQMFTAVKKGSADFAFALADAYNYRNADGTFANNLYVAFTAVSCLDYTYNDDPATMRAQAAQLAQAAPVLGPYLAYGQIGCATWPYKSNVQRVPIAADGSAPIIVVGTTGDPATPYASAQSMARELQNGHLVTYKGEGHTAYNKSNSCVNDTVDAFFVSGTVPAHDPMC